MLKRLLCSVGLFALASSAHAMLSLMPPPEGWEQEITPGFDPPIETVVAHRTVPAGKDAMVALWNRWGEGALPVLVKLERDERWRGFRGEVIALLEGSGSPEAYSFLRDRLMEIQKAGPDKGSDYSDAWIIASALLGMRPEESLQWLVERAPAAPSGIRPAYLYAISRYRDSDRALRALQSFAALGNPELKNDADAAAENILGPRRVKEPLANAPDDARYSDGKGQKDAEGAITVREARKIIELWGPRAVHYKTVEGRGNALNTVNRCIENVALSQGDKSVRLLTRITQDPDYGSTVMPSVLLALGKIGSKKSVAAFREVRIEALRNAGIPEATDGTHQRRMAEVAALVSGDQKAPWLEALKSGTLPDVYATVSPDYSSGRIPAGSGILELRRFGQEWLPVKLETIPIP